jgi:hypothetical protein
LFAFFKEGAEMRLHIRYRCNLHSLISFLPITKRSLTFSPIARMWIS